jgi:hypothetical protein
MKGGLFKIDAANVKSAVVYGIMTLVAIFLLSIFQNILDVGSIFGLDWKTIVDSAVVATIPSLIIGVSLMKNFLTNKKGEFLGVTEVIPDKK